MSTISMEDALAEVIQRAYNTIKNLCWLHVGEPRSEVSLERFDQWRVTVRVRFTVQS
jgi:flavin-binding protein dodecin